MDIFKIVDKVVHRYQRRCPWVDPNDLRNEGWVAALTAVAKAKEGGGYNPSGYIFVAVQRALAAFLWRQSHPFSAPDRRSSALAKIASFRFTSLDHGWASVELEDSQPDVIKNDETALSRMVASAPLPDDLVDDARWQAAASKALGRLLSDESREALFDTEHGGTEAAAAKSGKSVKAIYGKRARARRKIAADPEVRALLAKFD